GNPARNGLRLGDPGALPLRPGDQVRLEIELNRPAYIYVVWLEAAGTVKPIYPWLSPNRERFPEWHERPPEERPLARLTLPRTPGNLTELGHGDSGMESLLLLARDTPLPDAEGLRLPASFADLPPQPDRDRRAAAWFENGELVVNDRTRSAANFAMSEPQDDPVVRAQALLQA